MKPAFKLYRRKKIYYCEHPESGQQESLRTRDKDEAVRQLHAKNEAAKMGASNLQIARVYMGAADPHMPLRTWQEVVNRDRRTQDIEEVQRANKHRECNQMNSDHPQDEQARRPKSLQTQIHNRWIQ